MREAVVSEAAVANFNLRPHVHVCPQLIFCNEYTQAEGHSWHLKHFCCFDCDCILAGETYVMENDKPVCTPCYMKSYAVVRARRQGSGGWKLVPEGELRPDATVFPLTAEMLVLQEASGPRGSEGLLRRPPLARRATVLPVLRLLQVPDRPALHGCAGLPLLLSGVQKANHALDGLAPCASGPLVEAGRVEHQGNDH